jgi:hypothetical protein
VNPSCNLALLAVFICGSAFGEVPISLSADRRSFVAHGVGDGSRFIVRVEGGEDLPAMAGKVEVTDGGLRFTPRFPLTPGVRYRASVGGFNRVFAIPAADMTPVARVTAVYPSANVLPENMLKFYLHFSEPMAIGEASGNVRLMGEGGKQVNLPFLELAEELWDPDGKRLTLFFDPGRVKRGLKPHKEQGRALQAGREYRLHINAAWRDAMGRTMVEDFSKQFRACAVDYKQPDPVKWKVSVPSAGTRDAVRLAFPEALDHGLLERVLVVYNSEGKAISGVAGVTQGEKEWNWKPDCPWQAGNYRIVVEALLEDLAGNSIGRLFEEVDGMRETWNVRGGRFIRISFTIGG